MPRQAFNSTLHRLVLRSFKLTYIPGFRSRGFTFVSGKFFEPENLAYANYAYENDEFANNRRKRCGPCVLIPVAVPTSILVARAAVRAVSTTANIDFVYNLGKNVKKWFD